MPLNPNRSQNLKKKVSDASFNTHQRRALSTGTKIQFISIFRRLILSKNQENRIDSNRKQIMNRKRSRNHPSF